MVELQAAKIVHADQMLQLLYVEDLVVQNPESNASRISTALRHADHRVMEWEMAISSVDVVLKYALIIDALTVTASCSRLHLSALVQPPLVIPVP
jgi:hypothetical protein